MHQSAYDDARQFVQQYLNPLVKSKLRIADIGSCDVNGTLRPLFDNPNWTYVGCDISPGRNVDVVLPAPYSWLPLEDGEFDVVVSSQVVEHVPKPWLWIKEVCRVCKPGGMIYVCTPNTIGYHEFPIDCWRLWPDGMIGLFEEGGIMPLSVYSIGMDTTGIGTPGE